MHLVGVDLKFWSTSRFSIERIIVCDIDYFEEPSSANFCGGPHEITPFNGENDSQLVAMLEYFVNLLYSFKVTTWM